MHAVHTAGPDAQRRDMSAAADGSGSLKWRVLVDDALPGTANMARDHALAALARPGRGSVRFYRWKTATLSFGRNEPVTVGYRNLLRRSPRMGVVRRPTGGRAVIHDREFTYSVVLPAQALGGLRLAYRRINRGLVRGLRRLGVDAGGAAGRPVAPDAGPCFLEAAEGEVVVRGRKLVGSALARIGGAILQHGSLLLVADQSALYAGSAAVRTAAVTAGAGARPITLAEVLGEVPPWQRMVDAMGWGFAREFGGSWARGEMTPEEAAMAAKLETRYGSGQWTWRR